MTARTPDAEPLLTPAEVATMFRVDPKTVTRWAKAGKLTSIRTLGGHRRYRGRRSVHCSRASRSSAARPNNCITGQTGRSPNLSQCPDPGSKRRGVCPNRLHAHALQIFPSK